ncbi:MAG: DUF4345 domain-containing protein [Alphaproteobacteria bacterium]
MKTVLLTKGVLLLGGSIITGIGLAVLLFPDLFYATNGIALGTDPSLLSEVRASGGVLVGAGGLIFAGLFISGLASTSLTIAAVLYGAYGVSRMVSMALDGMPAEGLVWAAVLELFMAALYLVVLVRNRIEAGSSRRAFQP